MIASDGAGGTAVTSQTFYVATEAQLNQAIATVDGATAGTYTIVLTGNITEGTDTGAAINFEGQTIGAPADLYAFNLQSGVSVTLDGSFHTLNGANQYRGLFAYAGDLTVENLVIASTAAIGGAGGGGGAGLGGGLFVAGTTQGSGGANVTLENVSFKGDAAQGGAGGLASLIQGGGGLGGSGSGLAGNSDGDGGGVGVGATDSGAPGIILGVPAGESGPFGGAGSSFEGGGGVGGRILNHTGPYGSIGVGGSGGFGGGGNGKGAPGGFGGGGGTGKLVFYGGGGRGGAGGFGGGGGAQGPGGTQDPGGGGGGGQGGFGAGNGSGTQGGGGLAAGGDVFIQQGGSLTIEATAGDTDTVDQGSLFGGTGATDGSAYGDGFFLQGNQSVTLEAASGSGLVIYGAIADQSGSGGTGANAGAGSLVIAAAPGGNGYVDLEHLNTFTGGITIQGGTLDLSALGSAGSGEVLIDQNGTLDLDAANAVTGPIGFGPGGHATLAFASAFAPQGVIEGFSNGDTIDVTDASVEPIGAGSTYNPANDTLTLGINGAPAITLQLVGAYTAADFHFAGASGGTDITVGPAAPTPPQIQGTRSGQNTASNAPLPPFSNVTIRDDNVAATETLTISLSGSPGTLSGTGLTGGAGGVYTLSGSAAAVTMALKVLSFTPTSSTPNTSNLTRFTLSDTSSNFVQPVSDQNTTVTDTIPAVAPTITGAGGTVVTYAETPVTPFAGVTLTDANAGGSDRLTITVARDASNNPEGTLTGSGLGGTNGNYTLTGTGEQVTAALDGLVFTPEAGAPLSSTSAVLSLDDSTDPAGTPFTASASVTVDDVDFGTDAASVGSISALNAAIRTADALAANSGTYTITLTGNIALNGTAIHEIDLATGNTLDIIGTDGTGNDAIDGGGTQRGLFVYAGTVSISNLVLQNMSAVGGAGGDGRAGGGGGAGLGGGLFLTGPVYVPPSTTGGGGSTPGGYVGGANVTLTNVAFINDDAIGGAGGSYTGPNGGGGNGGGLDGGDGVPLPVSYGSGGGSGELEFGENGGFGTGGGGGYGKTSNGGEQGTGGGGGFGGGGGGGDTERVLNFFGTQTNTLGMGGPGGFGAGSGNGAGAGGGGLGAGGDVFVQPGAILVVNGGSLGVGTVSGGLSGTGSPSGSAFGDGLFIQSNSTLTLGAPSGQTLTIGGGIADQSGSGGTGRHAGAGTLDIDGPGTVALDATNSFTGGIQLQGGTLELEAPGAAGSGAITVSSGGDLLVASYGIANAIDLLPGGELDLALVPFMSGASASLDPSTDILTITEEFGLFYNEQLVGNYTGEIFNVAAAADGVGGTAVTVSPACYCRGTLIRTDRGDVAVEALSIGDGLLTVSGERRLVKWIGRRSYAGRFLAANPHVQPVRFRAGSLGDGLPRRDLLVSPNHAMFLDRLLIPARCLVNGRTIVQDCSLDRVDYYHVELDTHDVLLAEGAPSETFLDDDSRGMFHNAHEFAAIYPDAPRPDAFCAPRVEHGAELEAIRLRLALIVGEIAA